MKSFVWSQAAQKLQGFGGEETTLTLWKTGLPFFDALRLYGAIELYVGLREDIEVSDEGNRWRVSGKRRRHRIDSRPEAVLRLLLDRDLKKKDREFLKHLSEWILRGIPFEEHRSVKVKGLLKNTDSVLKKGVRDQSAQTYNGLGTGFGIEGNISLSDALFVVAGKKRIDMLASIQFLPVFNGRIDYSKVVSPIRVSRFFPNLLCAQALMLLLLKTSLFAEGYEDRLSAVVYNTGYEDSRTQFFHSGLMSIASTAIKQGSSIELSLHLLLSLQTLVDKSWKQGGKSTMFTQHTINLALWIMQPCPKYLGAMITGQEKFYFLNFFSSNSIVKEVFEMSHDDQHRQTIDYTSVQKFAKAVASAIYYARQIDAKDKDESNKRWYDEVTMLRSAPSAKAFKEKALILIEQAKRNNPFVGTAQNSEDFDPVLLLSSIGEDRDKFETFRDLFRMYLILESGPKPAKENLNDNQKGVQQ